MYYITFVHTKLVIMSINTTAEILLIFSLVPTKKLTKAQCHVVASLFSDGTALLFSCETERDMFADAAASMPYRIKKHSVILPKPVVQRIRSSHNLAVAIEEYRENADILRNWCKSNV